MNKREIEKSTRAVISDIRHDLDGIEDALDKELGKFDTTMFYSGICVADLVVSGILDKVGAINE